MAIKYWRRLKFKFSNTWGKWDYITSDNGWINDLIKNQGSNADGIEVIRAWTTNTGSAAEWTLKPPKV